MGMPVGTIQMFLKAFRLPFPAALVDVFLGSWQVVVSLLKFDLQELAFREGRRRKRLLDLQLRQSAATVFTIRDIKLMLQVFHTPQLIRTGARYLFGCVTVGTRPSDLFGTPGHLTHAYTLTFETHTHSPLKNVSPQSLTCCSCSRRGKLGGYMQGCRRHAHMQVSACMSCA